MFDYGGYPCWSCAELEIARGVNYVLVPTYDIDTGEPKAILAASYEGNQVIGVHYVDGSIVEEGLRLLPDDAHMRYWTQIFDYFKLLQKNKNPDKDDYFLFRTTLDPCIMSNASECVCGLGSGAGGALCSNVGTTAECDKYRCGMVAGAVYVFGGSGGGGGPSSGPPDPVKDEDFPTNSEVTDPFDPWAFWNSVIQGSGGGQIISFGDYSYYNNTAFRSHVISTVMGYLQPEGPQFCFNGDMIPDLGGTQFDNVTMVLYYALESGQYDQYQICNFLMFVGSQANAITSPEIGLYLLENPESAEAIVSWLNSKSNTNSAYAVFEALTSILMESGTANNLNSLLASSDLLYGLLDGHGLNLSLAENILLLKDSNAINAILSANNPFDATNFFNRIELMKISEPLIRNDRAWELYFILESDPDALVECGDPPSDISDWSELASFIPPENVLKRLEEMGEGWRLQGFLTPTAAPRINLDYFSTTITQMPINPTTNEPWVPDELFQHIRQNINDFVDTNNSEFTPIEGDESKWLSDNPTNTIISIDIKAPTEYLGDDGSVICAQSKHAVGYFLQ
jgi:hypothetical protein